MEPNIFSVLFNKTISIVITLGTLFYTSVTGVSPKMNVVQVSSKGSLVVVSSQIQNCFSEDFDKILSSGADVKLHFQLQLYDLDSPLLPEESHTLTKTFVCSLLDHTYHVSLSGVTESDEELEFHEARSSWVQLFEFPIAQFNDLKPGKRYAVSVTAWLDKVRVMGKEEPLNLMVYWTGIKPVATSAPFTRDLLKQ